MADASLQPIEIVRSEQEKVSWLRALLRRKRKNDGKSRVVVFVNTEESALALHAALRKSFTVAVNAGPHAAEGLVAFREGRRLVLITRDGQQPPGHLCSTGAASGAVAVSWEAPSSLGAHRARMKTAAGIQLCYQLLVLRHGSSFVPSLDPAYAHALLLSTMLAGKAAPRALQEAAAARDHAEPTSAGEKRRRAAAPTQSFVFYHGTHPVPYCRLCTAVWDALTRGAMMHGRHVHGHCADDSRARLQAVPRRLPRRRGLRVRAAHRARGCTPSRPSRSYPPFFACLALAARMTRRRENLHATVIGIKAMWGRG
jgi:hypothetical protein